MKNKFKFCLLFLLFQPFHAFCGEFIELKQDESKFILIDLSSVKFINENIIKYKQLSLLNSNKSDTAEWMQDSWLSMELEINCREKVIYTSGKFEMIRKGGDEVFCPT